MKKLLLMLLLSGISIQGLDAACRGDRDGSSTETDDEIERYEAARALRGMPGHVRAAKPHHDAGAAAGAAASALAMRGIKRKTNVQASASSRMMLPVAAQAYNGSSTESDTATESDDDRRSPDMARAPQRRRGDAGSAAEASVEAGMAERDFIAAVYSNQLEVVRTALSSPAHAQRLLVARDRGMEKTALHIAAEAGNIEMIDVLFAAAHTPQEQQNLLTAVDTRDWTPISYASAHNQPAAIEKIFSFVGGVPRKCAALLTVQKRAFKHLSPLQIAASADVVEVFLRYVQVDDLVSAALAIDKHGRPALVTPIIWGRSNVVELLFKLCNSLPKRLNKIISHQDNDGETLLHAAVRNYVRVSVDQKAKYAKIISMIIAAVPTIAGRNELINMRNAKGQTVHDIASREASFPALLAEALSQEITPEDNDAAIKTTSLVPLHEAVLLSINHTGDINEVRKQLELLAPAQRISTLLRRTSDGHTAFHHAMCCRNIAVIKAYLAVVDRADKKAVLTAVDNNGRTILHMATSKAHLEIFLTFAESPELYKKTCMQQDASGKTVMHGLAAQEAPEAISFLLSLFSEDERVQLLSLQDNNGYTALHSSIDPQGAGIMLGSVKPRHAEKLLKIRDRQKRTALHVAAQEGDSAAVRAILQKIPAAKRRAIVAIRDKDQNTAVNIAGIAGELETLATLLETLDEADRAIVAGIKNKDGKTIRDLAEEFGFVDVLEKSARDAARPDAPAPIPAAEDAPMPAALEAEPLPAPGAAAPPNETLQKLFKELAKAVFLQDADRVTRLLNTVPQSTRTELIRRRTPPNTVTLLHSAAMAGNANVVTALLEATLPEDRAFLANIRNAEGNTALYLAVLRRHAQVVTALFDAVPIAHARDIILQPNFNNETALHVAQDALIVVALLNRIPDGQRFDFIQYSNKNRMTALHIAAMRGNAAVVDVLLGEYSIRRMEDNHPALTHLLFAGNTEGHTALTLAVNSNNAAAVVSKLLAAVPHPTDVELVQYSYRDGMTSLHWAAIRGDIDVVKALLTVFRDDKARADFVQKKDKYNRTAIDCARNFNHAAVVRLLQPYMPAAAAVPMPAALAESDSRPVHDAAISPMEAAPLLAPGAAAPSTGFVSRIFEELKNAVTRNDADDVTRLLNALPPAMRTELIGRPIPPFNFTLLHKATVQRTTKIITALLGSVEREDRIRLINIKNDDGNTALFLAVKNGHRAITVELVNMVTTGARSNEASIVLQHNNKNETVFHVVQDSHILSSLCSLVPDDQVADFIQRPDNAGMTALHTAARRGDDVIVGLLLKRSLLKTLPLTKSKEFFLQRNKAGDTALMLAVNSNNATAAADVQKLLAAMPLSIKIEIMQAVNPSGLTALHQAVLRGKVPVVQAFLDVFPTEEEKAAFVQSTLKDNTTIDMARAGGHTAVVELLQPYMLAGK